MIIYDKICIGGSATKILGNDVNKLCDEPYAIIERGDCLC